MEKTIRIGTRGSRLALWQAEFTRAELGKLGVASELVIIKTQGDLVQNLSFDKLEGKGFFTKEIEEALLRGDVAVAVHSMKDLPTEQPDGLAVAAVSYRDDPRDWLVIRRASLASGQVLGLRTGATVGTSSNRRKAQMLALRPDCAMADLRGNVPTRLEKLRSGAFDAIFLAGAGASRLELDLDEFEVKKLAPQEFVPAPAQGALAWQTNADDLETRRLFKKLHRGEVSACTNVERTILRLMEGGCQLPLGAYCERDAANNFHVWASVFLDGELRRTRISSSTSFGLAEKAVAALKQKPLA